MVADYIIKTFFMYLLMICSADNPAGSSNILHSNILLDTSTTNHSNLSNVSTNKTLAFTGLGLICVLTPRRSVRCPLQMCLCDYWC